MGGTDPMARGADHHDVIGVERDVGEEGSPFFPLEAVALTGACKLSRDATRSACSRYEVEGVPTQARGRFLQLGKALD